MYFASGLYTALTKDKPLFDEPIETWDYGPVISDVYHEFKKFGNEPITSLPVIASIELDATLKDKNAKAAIDGAWDAAKKISAIQLSNWTHEEGSPWSVSKNSRKRIITVDLMYNYFKRFLEQPIS